MKNKKKTHSRRPVCGNSRRVERKIIPKEERMYSGTSPHGITYVYDEVVGLYQILD